ncbi:GIY-YIG nuclease family protein [Hymenobacter cellulosilyticus]|uniref:GIY-YIG nuclease family protein n=1 Tax=Hymenobacter cellulosilyticus TaxID=2932248 RepID=A0A8T9Q566_9BACT|nr:GIY-YIG nuclease family protein [Hymenobacter cellulosilyticus]UOQ72112.1 GIY-YIG nuclease family protein [Hymenobacter cellulosilyticus]
MLNAHGYYVYIVTNPAKTSLYTGVTNDVRRRVQEHFDNRGNPSTFAEHYYCYNLVYVEYFEHIEGAIAREKEIKGWTRAKKDALIAVENPQWLTLNYAEL